jgi:hypothetical protein
MIWLTGIDELRSLIKLMKMEGYDVDQLTDRQLLELLVKVQTQKETQ